MSAPEPSCCARWTDRLLGAGLLMALAGFVAAMAYQSAVWPGDMPGQAPPMSALGGYWIAFAMLWALLGLAAWRWGKRPANRARQAGLLILAVALVARLIVVMASSPVLSDDLWRYIHDGMTLSQGRNPYLAPPSDVAEGPRHELHDALLPRINHPHLVTIYQPASQYVFAVLAMLRVPTWDVLGDRVFRLGFVAFDMLIIALLLGQLRREGRSPWWAILYAWHPLAISEVAGSGHQDVIGIACLLIGLRCIGRMSRQPAGETGLAVTGGAALAAATAVKPLVLPVAFLSKVTMRSNRAAAAACALAGAVTLAALYLPFLLMEGGLASMVHTAQVFVDTWAFNASLHALARAGFASKSAADLLMATLLAGTLIACFLLRLDLWRAAGAYLLAALLLSSTAHPWYALWPLAILPIRFSPVTWVLSLTIAWSYQAHLNAEAFQVAAWIRWLEYLPVYTALLMTLGLSLRRKMTRTQPLGAEHEAAD